MLNGRGAIASRRRPSKGRWYTALVLLFLLPLVWVALGAWLLHVGLRDRSRTEPVAGWSQTTGWVVSFHTYQPSYANTPTYPAVIAFRAAGDVVTFSAPGAPVPPRVGAPVRVSYDPHNPADAHDLSLGSDGEGQIYLGVGFLVLGVAVVAFTYWLIFVRRSSARRAVEVFSAQSDGRHVRGE
jgi:hypothetical protein